MTCHVPAPSMDTSDSDSEDGEMPAKIIRPGRSTSRGRARARGGRQGGRPALSCSWSPVRLVAGRGRGRGRGMARNTFSTRKSTVPFTGVPGPTFR